MRDALLAEGLSPDTVSGIMRVLGQALGRAEAKGYGRNGVAASLVHRPVGAEPKFEGIDADLAGQILAAVEGTDPWTLLLSAGSRPGGLVDGQVISKGAESGRNQW